MDTVNARDHYLALDLETTGLNSREDQIIEVAWALLSPEDYSYLPDGELQSRVITPNQKAWELISADPFINDMHSSSGLLTELSEGETVLLSDVEEGILAQLDAYGDRTWRLFGASVHFDLAFVREHMPRLAERLSYRVFDTSTIVPFVHNFGYVENPKRVKAHRASQDIEWSIGALRELHEELYRITTIDHLFQKAMDALDGEN